MERTNLWREVVYLYIMSFTYDFPREWKIFRAELAHFARCANTWDGYVYIVCCRQTLAGKNETGSFIGLGIHPVQPG